MIRAVPGADGWVESIITQEVAHEWAPPLPAGEVLLHAEPSIDPALLHVQRGRLHTPHDDRVAWRRLRHFGHTGPEATELARRRDLADLPDVNVRVIAPPGHGITTLYPDVPGLRLRPMSGEDLDATADAAIEAGLQPTQCPQHPPCCQPSEAHAWFSLANRIDREDTWQLVLEHEGQPLQMELILVNGDQATFSYTTHFTRERPHWFWREAERPVFERMKAAGVSRIYSHTRKDRRDWIQALKENYSAEEEGEDERTVRLRYDPDQALAKMEGWPTRRKLPEDWTWQRGNVVVREATGQEMATLPDRIRQLWGQGHSRLDLSRRVLREWTTLDKGTVLLGFRNGTLTDVRVSRHRRGSVAGFANVSRLIGGPEQHLMSVGFAAWLLAAGYTKSTLFVEKAMLDQVGDYMTNRLRFRVVRDRSDFRVPQVEMEQDLPTFLDAATRELPPR